MRKILSLVTGMMLLASAALAANALPTVTAFTVPASAVSPIPVTALTATDSDGTVVGYMITETSSKPSATATGWSATNPTSYTTSKTGTVTLYAWAKDNAAGVSAAKTATTTLLAKHTHYQSDIVGLDATLAAKANVVDLTSVKSDVATLVSGLAAKADISALNAGLATKADAAALNTYQQKYANVIVVAQSGGNFTDPVSAMNSITDASADNRYLVKIMPGVYNITGRDTVLEAQSFVDIEGSGKDVTVLRKQDGWMAVHVGGVTSSEIRNLTIESLTGGMTQYVIPFIVAGSQSFQADNVNINIIFAPYGASGSIGVWVDGGNATLKNFKVMVSGVDSTSFSGYWLMQNGNVILDNATVEAMAPASGFSGIHLRGTNATVKDFKVTGVDFTNESNSTMSTSASWWLPSIKFYNSELLRITNSNDYSAVAVNSLVGNVVGKFKTFNCYNKDFDPISINN